MKIAFQCCSRWGQLFCEGLDSVRTLLGTDHQSRRDSRFSYSH